MQVSFQQPLTGRCCAESPDGQYIALIRHGVSLHVRERHAPDAGSVAQSPESKRERGGRRSSELSGSKASTLGHYSALDEVSAIEWSTDSSMVMLVERVRGTVEVVAVHGRSNAGLVCVARIDAGIDGLRSAIWHPNSRVLYYVGLCNSKVVDLHDGTTRTLPAGGVKLAETWHYANELLRLDASTGMDTTIGDGGLSSGCVLRPLLKFSHCGRFAFFVSPRQHDVPELLHVVTTKSHERCATIDFLSACRKAGAKAKSFDSITAFWSMRDSFLLFDEFHKGAAIVPARGAASGRCIVAEGIEAVAVNASASVVVMASREEARIFVRLMPGMQLIEVAPTPLLPKYLHSSTPVLTESSKPTAALDTTGAELRPSYEAQDFTDDAFELARSFEPFTELAMSNVAHQSVYLKSYAKSHREVVESRKTSGVKQLLGVSPTEDLAKREFNSFSFHRLALTAVSDSGSFAAVVSQAYPSTVVVIDLRSNEVYSVLRHRCVVTSLSWRPGGTGQVPSSRASKTTRTIAAATVASSASASGEARRGEGIIVENPRPCSTNVELLPAVGDALLICTDSHEGCVFMFQPAMATTICVPQPLFKHLYLKTDVWERLRIERGERHQVKGGVSKKAMPAVDMTKQHHVWKPVVHAPRHASPDMVLRGVSAALLLDLPAEESSLHQDSPVGFRVNRVIWNPVAALEESTTQSSLVLLCDDMRGAYIRGDFRPSSTVR